MINTKAWGDQPELGSAGLQEPERAPEFFRRDVEFIYDRIKVCNDAPQYLFGAWIAALLIETTDAVQESANFGAVQ